MTEQEIKTRIDKKEKEIQKIEKRIQKWTTGMNEEAKQIVATGRRELILIAQDTSKYGKDIYGEPKLAELLRFIIS